MKANVSGWFKQSLRHSNARRFGRAGGKYAKKVYSFDEHRIIDRTKEYHAIGDFDVDFKGKSKPWTYGTSRKSFKRAQDVARKIAKIGGFEEIRIVNANTGKILQQEKTFFRKFDNVSEMYTKEGKLDEKKYQEYLNKQAKLEGEAKKEVNEKYDEIAKDAKVEVEAKPKLAEKAKAVYARVKEAYKDYESTQKEKKLARLETELESIESVDDETRERLASMELKDLTDKELKELAVVEEEGFFGGNPYEEELIRRIKNEGRVETNLLIAKKEVKAEAKQRLTTGTKDSGKWIWE